MYGIAIYTQKFVYKMRLKLLIWLSLCSSGFHFKFFKEQSIPNYLNISWCYLEKRKEMFQPSAPIWEENKLKKHK